MLERCRPRYGLRRVALATVGLAACACTFLAAPVADATPLQQSRAKARALGTEIAALDASIDEAVLRYAQATDELERVRAAISRTQRRRAVARYELDLARGVLTDRVVSIYKHQEVTSLDVVFAAGDFDELVDQLFVFRRVQRHDQETMAAIDAVSAELARTAASLEADLRAAQELVSRRTAEYAVIRGKLAERRRLLGSVQRRVKLLQRQSSRVVARDARKVTPSETGGGGSGSWWPHIRTAAAANGVSAQGMYRLMMIESGGSATIVGGGRFCGLYQYCRSTWAGSWNPYRSSDILDGAAQIRATALALRLGKGPLWWGNSYAWAFAGS